MYDKLKMFGNLAKENEELGAAVRIAAETNDVRKLIELANQHGIELSETDFAQIEMSELDDEELDAVAGGGNCQNNSQAFLCGFLFFTDLWCPDGV